MNANFRIDDRNTIWLTLVSNVKIRENKQRILEINAKREYESINEKSKEKSKELLENISHKTTRNLSNI